MPARKMMTNNTNKTKANAAVLATRAPATSYPISITTGNVL
jgi:hypothetical protein